MLEEKLVKSPLMDEMRDEAAIEVLRKKLGAEQMLVVFAKGNELYHFSLGFCEHQLAAIADMLAEVAEQEMDEHGAEEEA